MLFSILIPVFNEINHIDDLISDMIKMHPFEKEIFLIDGGSTDGTRQKIEKWSSSNNSIKLIINEKKFVSFGFNKAYKVTNGKYIGFLGAHAHYPINFLKSAQIELDSNSCDAIGGPLNQIGITKIGQAVAFAMSSKFGVGDSDFRVLKERKYVQSVAFAVYKKEIFEKIGLLDEDLIRNQDDEFHYRLNKNGFRMLMIPEMQCNYYVRDNLKLLFKQYFEYGLYKPLVFKKLNYGLKYRHIIPSLFVFYIVMLPISLISSLYLIPLFLYLLIIFCVTVFNCKTLTVKFWIPMVLFTLHFSYGLGFILGVNKKTN